MKIMVNGRLVSEHEAQVSAYDHGFLYGLGLFETFRTYQGQPFLLEEHLNRLAEGCRLLGIPHAVDPSYVRQDIQRLLEVNGLTDAYIRYSVSAGVHELGLVKSLEADPTVIIYVKPLAAKGAWYTRGRPIQCLETVRTTPETKVRLKSFQYMNGWLAKQELQRYPWASEAEGIQFNERGELTEGIVSNLFMVRDQQLLTPSLDTGALPGITRSYVLRLASKHGMHIEEGIYGLQDLLEADEIFLTNSIQEIVPVSEVFLVDGSSKRPASQVPGSITKLLMDHYGKD